MNLGFFTMPIHPLGKDWRLSLKEDREAFLLAEELGFSEAYVGEHVTDRAENITSSVAFIAWIAAATSRIRLGTGTINMPNTHPATVAASIAMLDHMLDGRLIFGISPGGLLSDAELFGNLDADRNAMFLESINQVLELWAGEAPYNLKGKYWNLSTQKTLIEEVGQGYVARPLQKPHPPIVVTAVAPFSKGVTEAAARGWDPISANFLMPAWVKSHWPKYVEGCERIGRAADPANWRVAKSVFVANDASTAKAYATDPNGPYVYYYRSLFTKLKKSGRIELFKTRRDQPDDEVTLEIDLRPADHPWHTGQRCRSTAGLPGRGRRVRHAALCRQGLEGPRTRAPVHDSDGRKASCRASMQRPRNGRAPRNNPRKSARFAVAFTDRIPFQAQIDRPKLRLPGGKKLAVWVILNVEEWRIENAMPRTVLSPPMGQPLLPDVPNWSWHEYGMRAGFWRQFKALTDRNMPVTLALNANVCNTYPRVASAALEAGFEFMGHGFVQGPMHKLENQADAIRRAVETIAKFIGKPPRSWESPGLTETEETIDLLRLNGIEYLADWVIDDLPQDIATPHGTMTTIPYSVETNDIVIHALQHLPSEQFLKRCTDQFDRLYLEGASNARVMAISIHPYITGVPHRIKYLEALLDYVIGHDGVALMTASEIGDWYRAEMAKL